MEIIKTYIHGLFIIQPELYPDERGYFFESFNQRVFREMGIEADFVQDNQSMSAKGVLRGLHFQHPPHAQGKLVRVIRGRVMDVAVDIRKGSPTYGKWHSVMLSEDNHYLYWIPPGFAHGFLSLEDHTIFSYKCSAYYYKEAEDALRWNDPDLAIDWGYNAPRVSEKDRKAKSLANFTSPFDL